MVAGNGDEQAAGSGRKPPAAKRFLYPIADMAGERPDIVTVVDAQDYPTGDFTCRPVDDMKAVRRSQPFERVIADIAADLELDLIIPQVIKSVKFKPV